MNSYPVLILICLTVYATYVSSQWSKYILFSSRKGGLTRLFRLYFRRLYWPKPEKSSSFKIAFKKWQSQNRIIVYKEPIIYLNYKFAYLNNNRNSRWLSSLVNFYSFYPKHTASRMWRILGISLNYRHKLCNTGTTSGWTMGSKPTPSNFDAVSIHDKCIVMSSALST